MDGWTNGLGRLNCMTSYSLLNKSTLKHSSTMSLKYFLPLLPYLDLVDNRVNPEEAMGGDIDSQVTWVADAVGNDHHLLAAVEIRPLDLWLLTGVQPVKIPVEIDTLKVIMS